MTPEDDRLVNQDDVQMITPLRHEVMPPPPPQYAVPAWIV